MMPAAAPASSQSQQPQPQAWPPNPNTAVSIRGLFKHFDRKIAVNGLALDIPIGSFYGLVGPNGAGKTTTLNMVTGLLVPDAGTAMMGIGLSSGENRALDAAQQATNSALLEASIAGASRVLFSISGGPDLTLTEVDEAARTVEACADENANIIYGQIIDESMGDSVRITVIATGFAEKRQSPAKPIGAYSAAQEKATASKNQAQEDIDDIDEIFKIFNRN